MRAITTLLVLAATLVLTASVALADNTDLCNTGEYYGTSGLLYGTYFCVHEQQGQEGGQGD
jgi:hypothetical protein